MNQLLVVGVILGIILQVATVLGFVWGVSKFVTEQRLGREELAKEIKDLREDLQKHTAHEESHFEEFRKRFHDIGDRMNTLVAADVRTDEQVKAVREQIRDFQIRREQK